MICHENKLIYIHLPKCGGTSIEVAFTGEPWNRNKWRKQQHLTAEETRNFYGEDIFRSYFKFTIVRNTFDLLVAYYLWGCWGLRGRLGTYLPWGKEWGHPFGRKNAKTRLHPSFKKYIQNVQEFNHRLHFSHSGQDLTKQLASISINGQIAVDYVGRFEDIQNETDRICKLADIPPRKLPHLLKSDRKMHYSGFYNRKMRDLVLNKYRSDIDFFGFSFQRQARRWW